MATDSKDSEDTVCLNKFTLKKKITSNFIFPFQQDTGSKDSVDMVDKNKDRASEVMVLKLTEVKSLTV